LHQQPRNDSIGDRNFVNIAPFQLSEEVLRVHSARLDEALVTAALYLDARELKSAWQRPKQPLRAPSLTRPYSLTVTDVGARVTASIRFGEWNRARSQFSVANRCAILPRVAGAEMYARFLFDHDALRAANVARLGRELVTVGFERLARVSR
jgi:hypothetical protein